MKNRHFFYLQYNKIDWKNQLNTKINSYIYRQIIEDVLLKYRGDSISVFDLGFGIGFFLNMLIRALPARFSKVILSGCEPSTVNFENRLPLERLAKLKGVKVSLHRSMFQQLQTKDKFDFLVSTYVFPSFILDDLNDVTARAYKMIKPGGKFILVVANEKYLEEKIRLEKDLSIEVQEAKLNGKRYKEILNYAEIPKIGKVVDYNREERLYYDLFKKHGFRLSKRSVLNDHGFICTMLIFSKKF